MKKRAKRAAAHAVRLLGLYLDDLLLLAGGACVTRGVWELAGRSWAILTAGGFLLAYAVVVAKSRKGDG